MSSTASPSPRLRFTRRDYHRMAEAGIIPADLRVELIDGEVRRMSPISPNHSGVVMFLHRLLERKIGDRAICGIQCPVALNDYAEPEPDIVLLRWRNDFYHGSHPTPTDVMLMIEVASTSQSTDLGTKAALYAQVGIPEYWVFDLPRVALIIHREPVNGVYTSIQEFDESATVSPLAFPDISIDLSKVFSL